MEQKNVKVRISPPSAPKMFSSVTKFHKCAPTPPPTPNHPTPINLGLALLPLAGQSGAIIVLPHIHSVYDTDHAMDWKS